MQQLARGRGGVCLSEAYRNLSTRLSWRCANGHEWRADPYRITRGSWCPTCFRERKRDTLGEMQEVAIQRGSRCLSEVYIDSAHALLWECEQGHRWKAVPSVKHRSWCPVCVIKKMSHLGRRSGRRPSAPR
ncbi:zinc-ribbon domain-containing protein [Pseudomonas protegens]